MSVRCQAKSFVPHDGREMNAGRDEARQPVRVGPSARSGGGWLGWGSGLTFWKLMTPFSGAKGSSGGREKAGSSSQAGWAKSGIRESSEALRRKLTPENLRSLAGGDRQLQSCQASSRMSAISLGSPVGGHDRFGKDLDFSLDTGGKGGHFRRRPSSSKDKEAGGALWRIGGDARFGGEARRRDAAGQRH